MNQSIHENMKLSSTEFTENRHDHYRDGYRSPIAISIEHRHT